MAKKEYKPLIWRPLWKIDMKELIKLSELAAYLKVDKKTIYRAIKRNEIPYVKIRHQYRFNLDDVINKLMGEVKNETNRI